MGAQTILMSNATVLHVPTATPPRTLVLQQTNAAAITTAATVSPGEIITIYGIGLGPDTGQGGRWFPRRGPA